MIWTLKIIAGIFSTIIFRKNTAKIAFSYFLIYFIARAAWELNNFKEIEQLWEIIESIIISIACIGGLRK